jgi:hypothetical protein
MEEKPPASKSWVKAGMEADEAGSKARTEASKSW